jgi:hypothetical protein
MSITEKHKEFHKSLAICSDIEAEISEAEERVKSLKAKLVQAESDRDTKASDAAEELHAGGYVFVQMPDGTNRPITKAKKRKGGADPAYKFVVKYDERFDASMRRIVEDSAVDA